MNFRNWFSLNESFEIPFGVVREIYEYYIDCLEKFHNDETENQFTNKLFRIDLSNTKYSFLECETEDCENKIEYYLIVNIKKLNSALGLYRGIEISYNRKLIITGEIDLDFPLDKGDVLLVIYHEVLHFIQNLIKKHAGSSAGGFVKRRIVRSELRRNRKDFKIPKGNIEYEFRTHDVPHERRPIEHQTNLNSIIFELQRGYLQSQIYSGNTDLEKLQKDRDEKINHWKLHMNRIKLFWGLSGIKFDENLKKYYYKQIYKQFIDNENFLDNVSASLQGLEHDGFVNIQSDNHLKILNDLVNASRKNKWLFNSWTIILNKDFYKCSESSKRDELINNLNVFSNSLNIPFKFTYDTLEYVFNKIKIAKDTSSTAEDKNFYFCLAKTLAKKLFQHLIYKHREDNNYHWIFKKADSESIGTDLILALFYNNSKVKDYKISFTMS